MTVGELKERSENDNFIQEIADIAKKLPYSFNEVREMYLAGLTEKEISMIAGTIGNEIIQNSDGSFEDGWHHMARCMMYAKHEITKMHVEIISREISFNVEKNNERKKRFRDFPCWNRHRFDLGS